MTSEQQLKRLEDHVEALLHISEQLRRENQALHDREARLIEERAHLLKKNDMARSKVEAIISRLKSLEQES